MKLEDFVVGYVRDGGAIPIARAPWLVAQRGEWIGHGELSSGAADLAEEISEFFLDLLPQRGAGR